jgi:hypothetical protein
MKIQAKENRTTLIECKARTWIYIYIYIYIYS